MTRFITIFLVVVSGIVGIPLVKGSIALQNLKSIPLERSGDGWHIGIFSEISIKSDRHLVIHVKFEGVCRDQCYFEILGKRTRTSETYTLTKFSSNVPEGYASLHVNAPGVDELAVMIFGLKSETGTGQVKYTNPHKEYPTRLALENVFYKTYGMQITPASFNRATMNISMPVALVISLFGTVGFRIILNGRRKGVQHV